MESEEGTLEAMDEIVRLEARLDKRQSERKEEHDVELGQR